MPTIYDILEVDPEVSQRELTRVYHKRVRDLHHRGMPRPESVGDLAVLNGLWARVNSEEKRQVYDAEILADHAQTVPVGGKWEASASPFATHGADQQRREAAGRWAEAQAARAQELERRRQEMTRQRTAVAERVRQQRLAQQRRAEQAAQQRTAATQIARPPPPPEAPTPEPPTPLPPAEPFFTPEVKKAAMGVVKEILSAFLRR